MDSREQQIAEIEAILFSYGDPVSLSSIAYALDVSEEDALEALTDLVLKYKSGQSGIMLRRIGDKFQMCTNPRYGQYIEKVISIPKPAKLTDTQMQVLAFIAYRQPVTKPEIDSIRGTDSASVLSRLIEMKLIEEKGRLQKKGCPISYGTTDEFLSRFNLCSVDELPLMSFDTREMLLSAAEEEVNKAFSQTEPVFHLVNAYVRNRVSNEPNGDAVWNVTGISPISSQSIKDDERVVIPQNVTLKADGVEYSGCILTDKEGHDPGNRELITTGRIRAEDELWKGASL